MGGNSASLVLLGVAALLLAALAGLWAGAFVPPWEWRRGARLEGSDAR